MKKLSFNKKIYLDEKLGKECEIFFKQSMDYYLDNFLNLKVELYSDRDFYGMDRNIITKENEVFLNNIKHFSNFILYYIFNILLNNIAVLARKNPPYDINLIQRLSFSEKKYQYYLFLDDKIFGICVGTKFKNVLSLIQSIFPLIAKTDFLNEIRFFPISRMDYILNE
jgi:hypothetical protein